MSDLPAIIGLEVHVHLNTKSKLFCGCTTKEGPPNSNTCPICLGMPGSKPFLNEKAVEFAVKAALALNCTVNPNFFFSRKTYFYPDMAKNFQITQYELPIGEKGFVKLRSGKKVEIQRLHLEEDPASLVHEEGMEKSEHVLVDYNRSGFPMIEVVTSPCLESAEEAREFLNELQTIMDYLGIFVQGQDLLKADANISLKGGERVEIKNISSFKGVEKALGLEILRQRNLQKFGKKVERETRGFDSDSGTTKLLRTKESEDDYGYIAEPDIPRIVLEDRQVSKWRSELPELHSQRSQRFAKEFHIDEKVADVLVSDKALAGLFESVAKKVSPKLAAQFLSRELLAVLNHDNLSLRDTELKEKDVVNLLELLEVSKISEKSAKETLIKMVLEKVEPVSFIEKQGWLVSFNENDIETLAEEVLKENSKAVEDFKKGDSKALNFLVGQVLRKSKGKANPRKVQEWLEKKLK